MENTIQLLQIIEDLTNNFNINNIEDYKLFINLLYNNIVVLEEENEDINKALAILLFHIYELNNKNSFNYFSVEERLFSHILQRWMKHDD